MSFRISLRPGCALAIRTAMFVAALFWARVCARTASARELRWITSQALRIVLTASVAILLMNEIASAQFLRIAAYNIDADTGGAIGETGGQDAGPGLITVLQAIGNAKLNGHTQPLDVLALEELDVNATTTTLPFIVGQLNAIYGAGTYTFDTTTDPTTGGTGGGPSGLIYNTKTVQILGGALKPMSVGTVSGSGAARAPMRYTLAPLGYSDYSADFTMYVSHMKASSGASNAARRNVEAIEIRDDAATLGANAHIIYSGDYNLQNSNEAAYQTMLAPLSPTLGVAAGQADDTLGDALSPPDVWSTSSTYRKLFTESADSLGARFDFQLVTYPMVNQPGMQLVSGTLGPFGSNGIVTNVSSASNTALPDLGMTPYTPAYRTSVLNALTTATDHLPIVADYSFSSAVGIAGNYNHIGVVDSADYTLWQSTFGSTTNLAVDGNGDGIIDAPDYAVWRAQLGGMAADIGASAAVPEPSTAALLLIGGCLTGFATVRLRG